MSMSELTAARSSMIHGDPSERLMMNSSVVVWESAGQRSRATIAPNPQFLIDANTSPAQDVLYTREDN